MKTYQIFAYSALLATAAAQTLDSLPPCGQLCINNMLEKAPELGCAAGDAACLCKNPDFSYGIRDCSVDVCGGEAAVHVIAYGEKYCGGFVAPGASNGSVSAFPSATKTSDSLPSAVTTSAILTTITSGSEVHTSTLGFTTLYSTPDSIASSMASITLSIASSASSAKASLSSQLSSVSSEASSASESATASSTSSSSGARQTAFIGLAAAAGLAGLIL